MSLLLNSFPHHLPKSFFEVEKFLKPTALELFDPLNEFDHSLSQNIKWVHNHKYAASYHPRVPQKYRITIECPGYKPESISHEVKGLKLIVTGRQQINLEGEDFSFQEFKKSYNLPENSDCEKIVSFLTTHGQLVIEIPLKETSLHLNTDLLPKIVDTIDGGKQCQLNFQVPQNTFTPEQLVIDPTKVHVSIKDRDLIVKVEDKLQKADGISRFYYYKRATLPENTDFDHLKCQWNDNRLTITAPLILSWRSHRTIPIEGLKKF